MKVSPVVNEINDSIKAFGGGFIERFQFKSKHEGVKELEFWSSGEWINSVINDRFPKSMCELLCLFYLIHGEPFFLVIFLFESFGCFNLKLPILELLGVVNSGFKT